MLTFIHILHPSNGSVTILFTVSFTDTACNHQPLSKPTSDVQSLRMQLRAPESEVESDFESKCGTQLAPMTLGDDIVIEVGPKSNVAETQSSYVSYQFQSISNKFMSATV